MSQKEKDAYYFSHDSNARHDPDICEMRSLYGMQGYGWYWVIVEMLRDEAEYKLKISRYGAVATQLQTDRQTTEKFISDCIDIGLFQTDNEYFWSYSLIRRMKKMEDKTNQAKAAAEARWNKKNADAMREQCSSNAIKLNEMKDIKDVVEYFSKNIHLITPIEFEKFVYWNEKGIEIETIIFAIQEATLQDKRTMSYIEAILKGYESKGIKTLEQAENAKAEWQKNKLEKEAKKGQKKNNSFQQKPTFDNFEGRTYDNEQLKKQLIKRGKSDSDIPSEDDIEKIKEERKKKKESETEAH